MAARDISPFSAEQIADFNRSQAQRREMLQALGDALEVWRGCRDAACKRARSCRRSDGACFIACMRSSSEEDRMVLRFALLNPNPSDADIAALERQIAQMQGETGQLGA
ncbi:hypothetical protein [Bosea sp. BH3]|uniref:hypothetical protein n=1 Tax=Bosea sp. BH3 TaxID=2871701 RepID=UPI0021CB4127|nr:hypothetical protein [Bosea sp. BH3]MCU4180197.1 hypothetical protein [Bosea sp. BH3]